MKSQLQLNISSMFNKNYYRIDKNQLVLTKDQPQTFYHFDQICYSARDINSSIIYDIVQEYSLKCNNNHLFQITNTINQITSHHTNPSISTPIPNPTNPTIQPILTYLALFDQIQDTTTTPKVFIKQISQSKLFARQEITLAHFFVSGHTLYDYHKNIVINQEEHEVLQQKQKTNRDIEDNDLYPNDQDNNLYQQITSQNITNLTKTLSFIPVNKFLYLPSSTPQTKPLTKSTQLHQKKTSQLYILNIGSNLQIQLLLLPYTKTPSMTPSQYQQFKQFLILHGKNPTKSRNPHLQFLNHLMKDLQKLYYIMYFPGPKLTTFAQQIYQDDLQQKIAYNLSTYKLAMMKSPPNTITNYYHPTAKLCQNYLSPQPNKKNNQEIPVYLTCNQIIKSQMVAQRSKINNEYHKRYYLYINQLFQNLQALQTDPNLTRETILKKQLNKKQNILKNQLIKIKQRVYQLKLTQKLQQPQLTKLTTLFRKTIEKITPTITELQTLGVTNIGEHIDWLKLMPAEKQQQIKEEEDQIEELNKKIIEGRISHEFFVKKIIEFRDKLLQKQTIITKSNISIPKIDMTKSGTTNKQNTKTSQENTLQLSPSQCQQLEHFKNKQKNKMMEKLQNSKQKKRFLQIIDEVKSKIGKQELIKLQQKYFDLIHN